jgi:hypothetical protein
VACRALFVFTGGQNRSGTGIVLRFIRFKEVYAVNGNHCIHD